MNPEGGTVQSKKPENLPFEAPVNRFDAKNGPERTARFRFIGAWLIRLWIMFCGGFGGLMWSDPHLTTGQQIFGTIMFTAGTGLVLTFFMAMAWCIP